MKDESETWNKDAAKTSCVSVYPLCQPVVDGRLRNEVYTAPRCSNIMLAVPSTSTVAPSKGVARRHGAPTLRVVPGTTKRMERIKKERHEKFIFKFPRQLRNSEAVVLKLVWNTPFSKIGNLASAGISASFL